MIHRNYGTIVKARGRTARNLEYSRVASHKIPKARRGRVRRRQVLHCRRQARRGRVSAVSFCIVLGTHVVAEYVPSVFALS